jgi:hypothetical protein
MNPLIYWAGVFNFIVDMTSEQRAKKNEQFLTELGIPVNTWLPMIEDENEARLLSSVEIAKRILVLAYLVCLAYDDCKQSQILEYFESYELIDAISDQEMQLLKKENLDKKDRVNLSWRSEAIWLMLWAINKVDRLELPVETCDIPSLLKELPEQWGDPGIFFAMSSLRPVAEILDMSDLIYRLHWASRDAYLNKNDPPAQLHEGIIVERHYAINWITCLEDWDDITTDT